jgi:hypothetical protein
MTVTAVGPLVAKQTSLPVSCGQVPCDRCARHMWVRLTLGLGPRPHLLLCLDCAERIHQPTTSPGGTR